MINYRGLSLPLIRMGNVTSDNLFDPNEQVIFDFYEANKNRYRRVVDVGANIGVHSILMARLGWQVRAYEPDPKHFHHLLENTRSHNVKVEATQAAVSDRDGTAPFIRILNNTTGNHLIGAKEPYGPTEVRIVDTVNCIPLFEWADFAKIDCEGYEAVLIKAVSGEIWQGLDAILEVGSVNNAWVIFDHLRLYSVPMWAQKVGWRRVVTFEDMPVRHQDGSLFIGMNPPFPQVPNDRT